MMIAMALITTGVVVARYFFGGSSIAWQESIIYIHAAIFLFGASAALQSQNHVRVDILYRRLPLTTRAWIDSVGTIIFLLPVCAFIGLGSLQFVGASWSIREVSAEAGGLAYVYLLKTLIPASAACLGLQALAEMARAITTLLRD